jgi:hypothetical protein
MASLIARVTSSSPRVPLTRLLAAPLGLDVWEVKPDYVVLQAGEVEVSRLEAMGYVVEQLQIVHRGAAEIRLRQHVIGRRCREQQVSGQREHQPHPGLACLALGGAHGIRTVRQCGTACVEAPAKRFQIGVRRRPQVCVQGPGRSWSLPNQQESRMAMSSSTDTPSAMAVRWRSAALQSVAVGADSIGSSRVSGPARAAPDASGKAASSAIRCSNGRRMPRAGVVMRRVSARRRAWVFWRGFAQGPGPGSDRESGGTVRLRSAAGTGG